MTSVFCHIGQTGVELGASFWAIAAREARYEDELIASAYSGGGGGGKARRRGPLFDARTGHARAVFVDGDGRSADIFAGAASAYAPPSSVARGDRGCGKCFADGFLRRSSLVAAAEDLVRREAER